MHAVISDKKHKLAELCRRHGVARLEVFGSAAWGGGFRSGLQRRGLPGGVRPRERPPRLSISISTSGPPCVVRSADPSIWSKLRRSATRICARPSTGRANSCMHRDPHVLLAEIEQAGVDIARFTEDVTRETCVRSGLIQAAVERRFGIIGEALNRLQGDHDEIARRITGLRRIVDFRNLPSHGHDRVVPERVWTCSQLDLPELRRIVEALLGEMEPLET